jgi:hypothetical protein
MVLLISMEGHDITWPSAAVDETACYEFLLRMLHPAGLACWRCGGQESLRVHRRHREPVVDYRCACCGKVLNAWSGTALEKTHHRPSQIVRILQGIAQGMSTAQLAREIGCSRPNLCYLRQRLENQEWVRRMCEAMTQKPVLLGACAGLDARP